MVKGSYNASRASRSTERTTSASARGKPAASAEKYKIGTNHGLQKHITERIDEEEDK